MSFSAPLASRVATLKPSATVEMTERVRAARAKGRAIIGLSSGDPNIDTDPRIIEAAEAAMRSGDTHYGPSAGMPALREAIAERESRHAGAPWDPEDILVTPGGKFALLTALMAVVEPGDEVIVPAPGWVSYEPCVRLCGGVPVSLDMLDRIDGDALAAKVTSKSRAIILNSPVNPTGRVLSDEELQTVAEIAVRHGLWVIFDQVYADLMHDGLFSYFGSIVSARAQTIVVDSMSKTFGMTGWRLGYACGPAAIIQAMTTVQQYSFVCAPSVAQWGALACPEVVLAPYIESYRAKRDLMVGILSEHFEIGPPDGAFYLWATAPDGFTGTSFVEEAIRRNVLVIPGKVFSKRDTHFRICYTVPDEKLRRGAEILCGIASGG